MSTYTLEQVIHLIEKCTVQTMRKYETNDERRAIWLMQGEMFKGLLDAEEARKNGELPDL